MNAAPFVMKPRTPNFNYAALTKAFPPLLAYSCTLLTSLQQAMVRFGQIVVGPPGSGKTTYCLGMCQYLKAIGRDAAVINLDPANHGEGLPYTAAVDIQELVSVEVRII